MPADVHVQILDWDRGHQYALGRHVEHHAKSLCHPASVAEQIKSVTWPLDAPPLDQGEIGRCTGNGMGQCINTTFWKPTREHVKGAGYLLTEDDADALYRLATTLDDIPSQYPPDDTGSTGIAVAKAAQQQGYVATYSHAFGLQHMLGALQLHPVICGTTWTNDMFQPDANGFIRPSGDVAGGHEYLCYAADVDKEFLTFRNSWGAGWGIDGDFRITFADYDELLRDQGDVVVPIPVVVG